MKTRRSGIARSGAFFIVGGGLTNLRVEIENEKKKNHDCGLWKNWAEIMFFKVDKEEVRMGGTSDIGLGSGYAKIIEIETFCVDRVSQWVY